MLQPEVATRGKLLVVDSSVVHEAEVQHPVREDAEHDGAVPARLPIPRRDHGTLAQILARLDGVPLTLAGEVEVVHLVHHPLQLSKLEGIPHVEEELGGVNDLSDDNVEMIPFFEISIQLLPSD